MILAVYTINQVKIFSIEEIGVHRAHSNGSAYIMNMADPVRSLWIKIFLRANQRYSFSSYVNAQMRNM